jgi:tRNA dimethylallyltransferase
MIDKQPRILVVAGPTAGGKSALASALARHFGGVVINADSMQVYADLAILTARPAADDLAAAPHRLYGVLPVPQVCSAGLWRDMAVDEIGRAVASGKVPIVTGGTGLYLRALLHGIADIPVVPADVRAAAREQLRDLGPAGLHALLADKDPPMAARLNPADSHRIVRAWEVLQGTGRSLAAWQAQGAAPFAGAACTILVSPPPDVLGRRVRDRLEAMVAAGAVEEVRRLGECLRGADHPLARAVGVPQFRAHLDGACTLAEAVEQAAVATRQYAKRQRTWFRHQLHSNLLIRDGQSAKEYVSNRAEIFSFVDRFLLTGLG